MKRYLVGSLLVLILAACSETNNNTNNDANKTQLPGSMVNNPHTAQGIDTVAAAMKPTMDFKDTVHDFSTVHENERVTCEFSFTNNGKTPLIISSATGSCGCTVPEYPHDPIPPGQGGTMKVTFNSAGKSGHQEKSVEIHTNTVRSVHMLFVKADIKK
jgi:hypothetical protein